MHAGADLHYEWITSIAGVDKTAWDRLALPAATPLFEYDWLHLLESSGSVAPETGWDPRILLARNKKRLVAAVVCYVKKHSEGEFVYDYPWADVAERLGIPYYPKLVGMSPLTPVPAYQLLVDPAADLNTLAAALMHEVRRFAAAEKLSGIHLQYTLDDWVPLFTSLGYRIWEHACFLWENHGYKTFEDFLACFSKNQRRNIRREEQKLAERGITLSVRAGEEIPSEWSALMYSFYYGTNVKFGPWSCLYLTPAFFEGVFLRFRHRLVMVAAHDRRTPDPVGMAMFLRKGQRLWGRYWGSHAYIPHLHFNVCYYTPIRWAIAQGIRYFDPGIGSEHKARRGFVSRRGYSLHHFFDPRLQALFDDNIGRFNQLIREQIDDQNLAMPLHSARPENHGGHHACFREVRKP